MHPFSVTSQRPPQLGSEFKAPTVVAVLIQKFARADGGGGAGGGVGGGAGRGVIVLMSVVAVAIY